MRATRLPVVLFIALGCSRDAPAQVRQIDPAKLPQDASVQRAYTDLLPIDDYARNYAQSWPYSVSKDLVVSRFTADLQALEAAQRNAPSNGELSLLTGLVGHLAYNLDVESAYTPALTLLQAAESQAGQDFRPAWFLAMHQCESNDPVSGMKHLLQDEDTHADLPAAFWRDYALCAQVASMPAHALRAYDHIKKLGAVSDEDTTLAQVNRKRFKPSSAQVDSPKQEVWTVDKTSDGLRYTSYLCGQSFLVKPDYKVSFVDSQGGACIVFVTGSEYPTSHGKNAPTFAMFSQVAAQVVGPDEGLDEFLHLTLSHADVEFESVKPLGKISCPVSKCLGLEVIPKRGSSDQGTSHGVAVAFSSEQPDYPGLRLERPIPLPKPDRNADGPQFYHPDDVLERLPGTIYTFIALDSSAEIYDSAKADFDTFMHSMTIDSK